MLQLKAVMEQTKIKSLAVGFSPIKFLKEVKLELKKVKWPNKQEVIKMTLIVISVSLAVGLFIGLLDFILTKLVGIIIK